MEVMTECKMSLVHHTPDLHSGGVHSKSRPGHHPLSGLFMTFLSPSRQMPGPMLQIEYSRFVTNLFQFMIHLAIDVTQHATEFFEDGILFLLSFYYELWPIILGEFFI
jgi:hypothetical protein